MLSSICTLKYILYPHLNAQIGAVSDDKGVFYSEVAKSKEKRSMSFK